MVRQKYGAGSIPYCGPAAPPRALLASIDRRQTPVNRGRRLALVTGTAPFSSDAPALHAYFARPPKPLSPYPVTLLFTTFLRRAGSPSQAPPADAAAPGPAELPESPVETDPEPAAPATAPTAAPNTPATGSARPERRVDPREAVLAPVKQVQVPGTLSVVVQGSWADIWVDGEKVKLLSLNETDHLRSVGLGGGGDL